MSSESEPEEMSEGDYSAVSQTVPPPSPVEPEVAPASPAEPAPAPVPAAEPATSSEQSVMPPSEVRRAKRGKAHVDSDGPERKRGCPRRRRVDTAGASTSRPPPPLMVTYDQFHSAMWDHYGRHQSLSAELTRVKEDLAMTRRELHEAQGHIGRHERFFVNLREMFILRTDATLKSVVTYLIERFGFKPPGPPR